MQACIFPTYEVPVDLEIVMLLGCRLKLLITVNLWGARVLCKSMDFNIHMLSKDIIRNMSYFKTCQTFLWFCILFVFAKDISTQGYILILKIYLICI